MIKLVFPPSVQCVNITLGISCLCYIRGSPLSFQTSKGPPRAGSSGHCSLRVSLHKVRHPPTENTADRFTILFFFSFFFFKIFVPLLASHYTNPSRSFYV